MNRKIINLLAFATGAAVGSVITWQIAKRKCEQIIDEDISEFKNEYYRRNPIEDEGPTKGSFSSEEKEEYQDIIDNYINKEEDDLSDKPYVISPEEFEDHYDYGTVSLTYYADGTVTDQYDNVLENEDIENLVGTDALSHFGEFEDDSVFVRNDELRCDYEILRDLRKYSDIAAEYEDDDI